MDGPRRVRRGHAWASMGGGAAGMRKEETAVAAVAAAAIATVRLRAVADWPSERLPTGPDAAAGMRQRESGAGRSRDVLCARKAGDGDGDGRRRQALVANMQRTRHAAGLLHWESFAVHLPLLALPCPATVWSECASASCGLQPFGKLHWPSIQRHADAEATAHGCGFPE